MAKKSQVWSQVQVTCPGKTLKSYLLTQMQICTMVITCQKILEILLRVISSILFGKQTKTHRKKCVYVCVCRQKPNVSLHFWVPSETPAEEFLLADRAVNPRRGEQLRTTAEKHKLQVCYFSSPPQKQAPKTLCEIAPGSVHSCRFLQLYQSVGKGITAHYY